jgi:thiol-disulfide isomerase/thioredoxin
MKRHRIVLAGILLAASAAAAAAALAAPEEGAPKEPAILGPTTRAAVEAAEPGWVEAEVAAAPDAAAAKALTMVPPGAAVTVYFGTWCGDSRRELTRYWRALDEVGGEVPFKVDYVAVDHADKRPPELAKEVGLLYVPTFIVRRDGTEVGRIVESAPDGIEHDLAALLTGQAHGVVSGRQDLGGEGAVATP